MRVKEKDYKYHCFPCGCCFSLDARVAIHKRIALAEITEAVGWGEGISDNPQDE